MDVTLIVLPRRAVPREVRQDTGNEAVREGEDNEKVDKRNIVAMIEATDTETVAQCAST